MRIVAVFMKQSMPRSLAGVKVPVLDSTVGLQPCKKRVLTKPVRPLFTGFRDNEARIHFTRSSMRRAYAVLGLGTAMFFAAASLTLLPNGSQASSTEASFLVPAADGYGVAECLISNQACGQVVANTWCEAQGYTRAISFRQVDAEEMTGSIQKVSMNTSEHRPISITCSN
jgi:hypothetical protein